MSTIRRQSIISSGVVYFGFLLGFVNTYLFTREGSGFSKADYGLVNTFIALANIIYSFASLGMQAYINKFYPYYKDNLDPKENDMISWALLTSLIGFGFVVTGGWIFRDLVIRKYSANAPDLVHYYKWIFPFGLGLTLYSLLEVYAWHLRRSILANYLREVQFRIFTTVIIILFSIGIVKDFDRFIKIYSFTYLLLALVLLVFLLLKKELHLQFRISRVTRKFYRKVVILASFIWSSTLVYTISTVFDTLIIAAVMPDGLAYAGIYTLAQNISSLIQAPQRGIITASVGALSQAWKEKDMKKIDRIYQRSSINQILFSAAMFALIWMNFTDGVDTFHLNPDYKAAQQIFLFIGLMRIIDMGTGVNAQIIGTSTFWRFDFITGLVLMAFTLPLNYLLTRSVGVTGPAIANLFAFTLYNAIRYIFLYRKFNLQPFSLKSLLALLLVLAAYLPAHFLFAAQSGFGWMAARSSVFLLVFVPAVLLLKISPDIIPVWQTVKGKFLRRKTDQ